MPTTKKAKSVLPIQEGEKAWTEAEVTELRTELEGDVADLRAKLLKVDQELTLLLQEGNDGAGRDTADVGSNNFERDTEMTLSSNLRDMLDQTEHALERLDTGHYGVCESCGEPIGKGRLQAFPRATMCMSCKTREERR